MGHAVNRRLGAVFKPVKTVQLAMTVIVGALALVAAWLGSVPWSQADRSTFFVFLGLAVIMLAIVQWPARPAGRWAGVAAGVLGLAGVVAYFLQAVVATSVLLALCAVAALVAAFFVLREPSAD